MPRMLAIGTGPGPKNVLVELDDGTKTVVPYAIWKHKLSKEGKVADNKKVFRTVLGFVQFPVEEREAAGQTVRDVTIRQVGSEGPYIRITLWPEFAETAIEEGDFVAIDGPFEVRIVDTDDGQKQYLNVSAGRVAVLGHEAPRTEREVKSKSRGTRSRKSSF